ncbi:MAG: hypothetical protein RLZZ584_2659 [Pseudomonadota bacterium]
MSTLGPALSPHRAPLARPLQDAPDTSQAEPPPGTRMALVADGATDASSPDTADEPLQLWNPNAAALLSLVFTPVFGAVLHCCNAVALGDTRLRRVAWMWLGLALAFTASGLYLVSLGQLRPTSGLSASALLSGYTMVWYAFAGYKQSRLVARLGQANWQPRSLLLPVMLALLCMALPGLLVWWPGRPA